jgi:PAS domain S-box-containing protein
MERDQKQENGDAAASQLPPRRQATIAPSDKQPVAKNAKTDSPLTSLPGSERHYRSLTSTTAQIFWTAKVDGTVDDVPMWRAYTGQTQEEIKGHGWLNAVHPDDVNLIYSEWQRALIGGNVFEIEYRLLRYDGVYRTFLVRGIPVFEPDGRIREWVGASTDITEKNLLKDELRESEQRFRATFEQATIGIAHINLEGHFLLANQKFCEVSGYTYEELQASTTTKLLLIENPEKVAENALKLVMGEIQTHQQEMYYMRNNGFPIWVNFTLSMVRDAMGKPSYFLATVEDITERKREERRTHDALNALLAMAESLVVLPEETDITLPLSIFTNHEITQHLTELTCKVLGCQHVGLLAIEPQTDEIIPIAIAGFTLSNEQKEAAVDLLKQQFIKNLTATHMAQLQANEIIIVDRDQLPILPNPHQIRLTLVAPLNVYNQFIGILFLDYGSEEHEYTNDETSLVKAIAHLAALVIERQRLLTERAEAQAAELAQREANRRMDEFLSIASHELRTPLTTISVHVQVANRLLRKSQQQLIEGQQNSLYTPLQEMLDSTERQVEVLNRLVNDLIDISRIQTDKLELHTRLQCCDLILLLQEVVANQRYRTPLRTIELELPPTQATSSALFSVCVLADPDRITQVIVNYLTNALTYSAPDQIVILSLQIQENTAHVSVRDKGLGLSQEEITHIWDRFYQVNNQRLPIHTTSAGLGLGLYISRSLVEQHGGQVGVESTPGEGSTFWFTLPLAQ